MGMAIAGKTPKDSELATLELGGIHRWWGRFPDGSNLFWHNYSF
jgi:hypothetical protein